MHHEIKAIFFEQPASVVYELDGAADMMDLYLDSNTRYRFKYDYDSRTLSKWYIVGSAGNKKEMQIERLKHKMSDMKYRVEKKFVGWVYLDENLKGYLELVFEYNTGLMFYALEFEKDKEFTEEEIKRIRNYVQENNGIITSLSMYEILETLLKYIKEKETTVVDLPSLTSYLTSKNTEKEIENE